LSSRHPSRDNRFLTLRAAGQDATDFQLPDEAVSRFAELRDQGADREAIGAELDLSGDVVDALIRADDSWALAHRIAQGEEPMYPPPDPSQRVMDTRSGSSRVPLLAVLIVLVGAIVYGLLR
jgi:hypothetical protein